MVVLVLSELLLQMTAMNEILKLNDKKREREIKVESECGCCVEWNDRPFKRRSNIGKRKAMYCKVSITATLTASRNNRDVEI